MNVQSRVTLFRGFAGIAFAACAFAVIVSAHGATYEFINRNRDNDYLGSSTWKTNNGISVATSPGPGDGTYVTSGTGHDVKVTVPGDVSVDLGYLVFKAQPSSSFKFYTTGDAHTFELPYSEGGMYSTTWALAFQNGEGVAYAMVKTATSAGPCFSWTDPYFTLSSDGDSYSTLVVSRGTYDFLSACGYDTSGNTFKMESRSGVIVFGTNVVVKLPKVEINNSGAHLRFRGSQATWGKAFDVKAGHVEVSDGATVSAEETVQIYGDGVPSMTVSNASLTVLRNLFVGLSNDGKLIVEDGAKVKVNGGDAIQIGQGGGYGGVEVRGGELTTTRMRISRSGATAAKTAYFLQTGGTTTLTGTGIQFQQFCTDNNLGTHYVKLDGGVLEAASIFRDATVTAGTVYLSGDGGTYKARSNGSLAYNLAYAECGEKGLTVDTGTYNPSFAVDGQNKSGANGLFVKSGTGTLTLAPPSYWTVSRTVVSNGTLKVAADATLATAIEIAPGAKFSTVGSAAAVAVGSIAATNAVVALDPGDVITVNGPINIWCMRIEWSTVPDAEQTFLVADHRLSVAEEDALRRILYANDLETGTHSTISFSYDDSTGKTSVKTKVVADEPLSDAAVWTGAGAWATAANWENGVKPDSSKVATFGAGSAGQTISIAEGDWAGALSFTGGAYKLQGTDAVVVAGASGGARIDVAAGEHVIAAPIDALDDLPVAIASGATLSIDGHVVAGGMTKSGLGKLVLGGTLETTKGFLSSGGLVSITNATALGETFISSARISAGTFEFRHPAGEAMTVDATVSMSATNSSERIMFKTDTDATLTSYSPTLGSIYKRGAGTLTIDVPANTTRDLIKNTSGSPDTAATAVDFPADGSAPTGTYAPVSIAEGDLRLLGRGANSGSRVEISGGMKVGVPLTASTAQASLTVDGAYVICRGMFYPGYCASTSRFNAHPSVRIMNGGTLAVFGGVQPGYSCTQSDTAIVFAITNGTYRIDTDTNSWLTRGRLDGTPSRYIIVRYLMNASSMMMKSGAILNGSILIDADNGSFVGKTDGGVIALSYTNPERIYGEMFFHNGSTFGLGSISESSGQTRDLIIAFDDAEWLYNKEHGDKTWPASTYGHVRYEMRGKGVILKPVAGATFTTLAPFTGAGGLVVDGEGTVAFGENTAQFSGALDVRQGTADFSANGGAAAFTAVKGAGTVDGATMGAVTLPVTLLGDGTVSNVLTFADCTFAGRVTVDFGRTEEDAFAKPYPSNLLVARYSGTTDPAVANWRMVGSGLKGHRGVFTAANGEIRMTVSPTGMIVIFK